MRILANYGYKSNGDSYSVTFETVGDVPKDKADATVDELFRMAKQAIERQVHPGAAPAEIPLAEEATGPGPEKKGNGNGKPRIKEPNAPATPKQKGLIRRLAREKEQFIEGIESFNMQEASEIIDQLMALSA